MKGTFSQFMRSVRYKVTITGVLLLLMVSLMACGHTMTLMPTPEFLRDKRVDFFAHNSNLEKNNKVTIYVHGANSSFYRAAAQGAQYRYFTGKQAVVLLFAWPSAENILLYETGMKHNKQSVPDFNRLLRMMATYSNAKRIHIIGYSAGGRLSGDALGRLGREYELENPELIKKKFRFG